MISMKVAGIRELKNKLSQYLRMVAEGEVVLVSDRGEVVAQLAPPPTSALKAEDKLAHNIARLERSGAITRARGQLTLGAGFPPDSSVDVESVVDDVRGDRLR